MFSSSIKYHRYYHYPDVSVSKLINKHDYYLRPLWGNFAETVRVSSEKTGLASCTSFISLVLFKFVELSFLSGALEEILSGQQFRSEYGILMRTRIDSSSSVDSFSSSFPSKNIRPRFYILRINEIFNCKNTQNTRNMRKIFKLSFLSIISSLSFVTFVTSLQFA